MSPLQYQKRLRIQEARRLMLGEGLDAAEAAYRVGYEGHDLHAEAAGSFEAAEAELRRTYETSGAPVPWERARHASRAAWTRVAEGEEKKEWWSKATEVWPDYDGYQAKTDREIPLIILEPVG